jgi:hypothetical protein
MRYQVYLEVTLFLVRRDIGLSIVCDVGQKIKLVIAACLWNNPQVCFAYVHALII